MISPASSDHLPAAFGELEPLVAEWAIPISHDRNVKRINHEHDRAHLQRFYDAMLPHMDLVLEYLNTRPLVELDRQDRTLLDLALMFAEVAHYVELRWRRFYGALRVRTTVALPYADSPYAGIRA